MTGAHYTFRELKESVFDDFGAGGACLFFYSFLVP